MKNMMIVFKVIIIFSFICVSVNAKPLYDSSIGDNYQNEILTYINTYQTEQGLKLLKLNKEISAVATYHSQMMAEEQIPFGHVGFNHRMRKLFSTFNYPHAIAENVAYSYTDAKGIVKLWLESPGHRKNIVGNYNLTGVGYAYGRDGQIYVTQIFMLASNE